MTWFRLMSGEVTESESRLCVRQFMAEGLKDDLFAGTPVTFFVKYLVAKLRVARISNYSLLTSVLH